jgi:hypothetical protein
MVFFAVGMARIYPTAPVSSLVSTMYTCLGFLLWVALESVKRVSRVMRATLTLFSAFAAALGFYMSAYVWQDQFLVDLNIGVPGVLTKYSVQRTCLMNLGFLISGSLYTTVFDWKEGKYMAYVSGYVPRKEVLEMESVFALVVGDSEGEVDIVQDDGASSVKSAASAVIAINKLQPSA